MAGQPVDAARHTTDHVPEPLECDALRVTPQNRAKGLQYGCRGGFGRIERQHQIHRPLPKGKIILCGRARQHGIVHQYLGRALRAPAAFVHRVTVMLPSVDELGEMPTIALVRAIPFACALTPIAVAIGGVRALPDDRGQ